MYVWDSQRVKVQDHWPPGTDLPVPGLWNLNNSSGQCCCLALLILMHPKGWKSRWSSIRSLMYSVQIILLMTHVCQSSTYSFDNSFCYSRGMVSIFALQTLNKLFLLHDMLENKSWSKASHINCWAWKVDKGQDILSKDVRSSLSTCQCSGSREEMSLVFENDDFWLLCTRSSISVPKRNSFPWSFSGMQGLLIQFILPELPQNLQAGVYGDSSTISNEGHCTGHTCIPFHSNWLET